MLCCVQNCWTRWLSGCNAAILQIRKKITNCKITGYQAPISLRGRHRRNVRLFVNHVSSLSISSNHGTFSILQESLAVRVWRPSPIEKIYDESTQGTVLESRPTFSELLLCRYLYSFSYCCLPNLRNPARFSKNSNLYSSRSPKVIDLGVNWKGICNFLLVINSNFGRISYSLGLYAICCRALKS